MTPLGLWKLLEETETVILLGPDYCSADDILEWTYLWNDYLQVESITVRAEYNDAKNSVCLPNSYYSLYVQGVPDTPTLSEEQIRKLVYLVPMAQHRGQFLLDLCERGILIPSKHKQLEQWVRYHYNELMALSDVVVDAGIGLASNPNGPGLDHSRLIIQLMCKGGVYGRNHGGNAKQELLGILRKGGMTDVGVELAFHPEDQPLI